MTKFVMTQNRLRSNRTRGQSKKAQGRVLPHELKDSQTILMPQTNAPKISKIFEGTMVKSTNIEKVKWKARNV